MEIKTLTINNSRLNFKPGATILEIASANGIHIPTLCYLKGTTPTGACRICLVELEGAKNLVTACSTPASQDMVIHTDSPRVIEARRLNIELLLASGDHNCLAQGMNIDSWADFQLRAMERPEHETICPAYGDCRLQELAIEYRIKSVRFKPHIQILSIQIQ